MQTKTAVILAAGMGTRLKGKGELAPKGFLQFGERPIIEESIARLKRAGIARLVIVTGHLREFYDRLAAASGGFVETVHNPVYADSGSMYSLYLTRERVDEDILLLESDLIYEQRALDTLLASGAANALLLSGQTGAGDEVYVEAKNGRLVNMSKDRTALRGDIAGELVGITRVSRALLAAMFADAERRFRTTRQVAYETDCLVAVAKDSPVECIVVPDLLWSEIDDEAHLARAAQTIYPAIQARDAG